MEFSNPEVEMGTCEKIGRSRIISVTKKPQQIKTAKENTKT